MNDEQLESHLRELRPRPLTGAAQRAIGARLARRSAWATWAGAAAAIAACLLAAVVLHRSAPDPRQLVATRPASHPAPLAADLATLWMYNQAANESPESVEALLSRDAQRLAPARGAQPVAALRI